MSLDHRTGFTHVFGLIECILPNSAATSLKYPHTHTHMNTQTHTQTLQSVVSTQTCIWRAGEAWVPPELVPAGTGNRSRSGMCSRVLDRARVCVATSAPPAPSHDPRRAPSCVHTRGPGPCPGQGQHLNPSQGQHPDHGQHLSYCQPNSPAAGW